MKSPLKMRPPTGRAVWPLFLIAASNVACQLSPRGTKILTDTAGAEETPGERYRRLAGGHGFS